MRPEKVLSVLQHYKQMFQKEGIIPKRMDIHSREPLSQKEMLAHAYFLTLHIPEHISRGKIRKAMRHLGSLQTLLRTAGWRSLADLMDDNRPPR